MMLNAPTLQGFVATSVKKQSLPGHHDMRPKMANIVTRGINAGLL